MKTFSHLLKHGCGIVLLCCSSLALAVAVDKEKKIITLPMFGEPNSASSLYAWEVFTPAMLTMTLQEGLLRYDERRRLVGGVAETWTLTPAGAEFRLRDDARWQNGEPVTADDFVFAWQQIVDPVNATVNSEQLHCILNAEAINAGDKPVSSLGVTAIDKLTLKVTFGTPCDWFLSLLPLTSFYPINEKFFRQWGAEKYGTSAESMLANGAFKLDVWDKSHRIHVSKNPHYWRRTGVHLNGIHWNYLTTDYGALLNLYKSGEVAAIFMNGETISQASSEGYRVKFGNIGLTAYLGFNHLPDRPTNNLHLRKAIALVIDRDEMINKVLRSPGLTATHSLIASWVKGGETRFNQQYPPTPWPFDLELARAEMKLAREELGIEGELILSLLVNSDNSTDPVAEYLQQRLKNLLGITIRIDTQNYIAAVVKQRRGEYDLRYNSTVVRYDDPMAVDRSWTDPNFRWVADYAGAGLENLYNQATQAPDMASRLAIHARMRDYSREQAVVIPLYETKTGYLRHPDLRGVIYHPVRSVVDYRYTRIVGEDGN